MRIVAVIQARMDSTRLPGKVLKDIEGETMLARVVHRSQRVAGLDAVLVATTELPADLAVVSECKRLGVPSYRGSAEDVLDRYYHAALAERAEAVVRITADCPLLDSAVGAQVVAAFSQEKPDYASNTVRRTYPRGLDTEIMTAAALACAWREATIAYQRAHVTPYIYQNPWKFQLRSVTAHADHGGHRWTVDTAEDLDFARAVYARLGGANDFGWRDVLDLLEREPELRELNCHIRQKALEEC
jgi:spore coat polysaccharide biosynthesis protein SpsF